MPSKLQQNWSTWFWLFGCLLWSSLLSADKTAGSSAPIQTMIIDSGFKSIDNRSAYWFEPLYAGPKYKYFDEDRLTTLTVPALASIEATDKSHSPMSLLEANLLAADRSFMTSHSTMVAQLFKETSWKNTSGEDEAKPIPVPEPMAMVRSGAFQTVHQVAEYLRTYFEALDKIIKSEGVRIAVRTQGLSAKGISKFCSHQKLTGDCELLKESYIFEYRRLIRANSQTAFVISAGNTGRALDEDSIDLHFFNEPNVLSVAALNDTGDGLAVYSSWHSDRVRIAAPGATFDTTMGGAREDGTSFAAPRVALDLKKAMSQEWIKRSAAKSISRFLKKNALPMSAIKDKVSRGLVLNRSSWCERLLNFLFAKDT